MRGSLPVFSLWILILSSGTRAQFTCPPEAFDPCDCLGLYRIVFCKGIEMYDVKEIFDRASQYIGDDVILTQLLISESVISEIGEGAVEELKFSVIQIRENYFNGSISPLAFNGSGDTTQGLYIEANNFTDGASHEMELYGLVNNFEKLEIVSISGELMSVPDNMFQQHTSLREIHLKRNNISRLGSRAFATGSEKLEILDLSHNTIPSGGLTEDAFEGISRGAEVYLECNQMEFMEQRSFQTLLDRAARISVGWRGCREPLDGFHCDERAHWICDNEVAYRPKLNGFLCKDGSGFEDIWGYCAGRNMTAAG